MSGTALLLAGGAVLILIGLMMGWGKPKNDHDRSGTKPEKKGKHRR